VRLGVFFAENPQNQPGAKVFIPNLFQNSVAGSRISATAFYFLFRKVGRTFQMISTWKLVLNKLNRIFSFITLHLATN